MLLAGSLGIFATGCWMMAAQLAPVAINAAETVGAGAVDLATGVAETVTMENHKDEDRAKIEAHEHEKFVDDGDTCDQLAEEVPGVIELRKSASGAPEYRELGLADSPADAQWAPITDKGDAEGGWRPAVNFLKMNFSPPLTGAVPETESNYLAYAPVQSISEAEADRLSALTTNFGKTLGTFSWSGRDYHYAVTRTLPCFPPPAQRSAANSEPGS